MSVCHLINVDIPGLGITTIWHENDGAVYYDLRWAIKATF